METVKGFSDFTGEEAQKREQIRSILVSTFQSYGFEPAEAPIVEYREFVRGENVNDEAVSDIFRLEDRGKRELALRYEHTFQLKRLMQGKKLPYKRFAIGPVFRDEPVKGNRLRQISQCDVDTLGATIQDEAELLKMVKRVLSALNIEGTIYINNRKLLNEILEKENIEKMDFEKVIREIDKLDKLDRGEVENNLRGLGATNLLSIFEQPLEYFKKYESYKEIEELMGYAKSFDVDLVFTPSLARGLSYYNRTVFEIKTKEMKETLIAGGSYMFNGVQCTGISFGLDRLAMLANLKTYNQTLMVLSIGEPNKSIEIAEQLRNAGIACIVSYDKISKSLEYANAKSLSKVIFVGSNELSKGVVKVRDMTSGKEEMVDIVNLVTSLSIK